MASPPSTADIPFPSKPRFRFTQLFKRNPNFPDIYKSYFKQTAESFKLAQQSLDQTISAICGAIDRILSHKTIPAQLGPDIEDLRSKYHAFREYLLIVHTLGLTTDGWIGEHTQHTLVTVVYLISITLLHVLCLLHPRWLHANPGLVKMTHDSLDYYIPAILRIAIPWDKSQKRLPPHWDINRTKEQCQNCELALDQAGLCELPNLFAALEKKERWNLLSWQERYSSLLRKRFNEIGLLLARAELICSNPKWAGLMLPLPSQLTTEMDALADLTAKADLHIRWIKPEVMARVAESFKLLFGDFDFKDPRGRRYPDWKDNGRWLMNSEQYQGWFNSAPGSDKRFLWCLGGLGMGKSYLMDSIIGLHERDYQPIPIWKRPIMVQIHFRHTETFDDFMILCAILRNALSQIIAPTNLVVLRYQALMRDRYVTTSRQLLVSLLRELTEAYTMYLFLDGLDECEPGAAEELIRGLVSIGPAVRIICFSRPTTDIHPEAYPIFRFMEIQAHPSDIELCLREAYEGGGPARRGRFAALETRAAVVEQTIANCQGAIMLVADQMELGWRCKNRDDAFNRINEIPEAAFGRFKDTMYRISKAPSGKDVRNLIAWVAVNKALSISKDIPHLQSQFTAPDVESIRRLTLQSLGVLRVVDGDSVTFFTHLTEAYILTKFSEIFPTFVSDVQSALLNPPMDDLPVNLKNSFAQFESFLADQSRDLNPPALSAIPVPANSVRRLLPAPITEQ